MMKELMIVLLTIAVWNSAVAADAMNEWQMTQMAMVFKFEEKRATTLSKIRKADEMIAKASGLIERSQKSGNETAAAVAFKALQTAQENKRMLETAVIQIDRNIANIRNRMNEQIGSDKKISGIVVNYSGRVRIISGKPPYEAIAMDREYPGYFEEGDTIETYGESRADVQLLDGRASMSIGEYSRIKMEKKDLFSETVLLAKGKIYSTVEKAETFAAWIEQQALMVKDDPYNTFANKMDALRAWAKKRAKKFEVRTPTAICAVRGTTFSIESSEDKSEIKLIEGEIAVNTPKTSETVILKGGEKMTVDADGTTRIEPLVMSEKPWWQ